MSSGRTHCGFTQFSYSLLPLLSRGAGIELAIPRLRVRSLVALSLMNGVPGEVMTNRSAAHFVLSTRPIYKRSEMHKGISKIVSVYLNALCALSCGLTICVMVFAAGCSDTSSLPPVATPPASTDTLAADPQVHEILAHSCFDCHFDSANGPWNAKLAPSYLFGAHKAQEVLNFSNWPALDTKQRSLIAAEITSVVADGSMPPGDYDFLHPSAKLNDEQKSIVLQWAREQTALAAH
jgi:hypothetical protein